MVRGSGVVFYNVYVAEGDSPYEPWLVATPNTSGLFQGELGKTYHFVAEVVDNVGNHSPMPITAQASTLVNAMDIIEVYLPTIQTTLPAQAGGQKAGTPAESDLALPLFVPKINR
jgi:hypothetical protein